MKISIWDILAIFALLGAVAIFLVFVAIYNDPYMPLNPFQPPTLPAVINYPTFTPTLKKLPPTWTPTPVGFIQVTADIHASSTLFPSNTPFTLNTFTATATSTSTPTSTPTITLTPTSTRTRTPTKVPTSTPPPPPDTPTPTDTLVPTATATTGYP